jgi:hypothetical protein
VPPQQHTRAIAFVLLFVFLFLFLYLYLLFLFICQPKRVARVQAIRRSVFLPVRGCERQ